MAGPEYPNVPQSEGVPPVKRDTSNPGTGQDEKLTQDDITVNSNDGQRWGIYNEDGTVAIISDNIVAVDYRSEYRIADYPIEQGGFETYMKVAMPFQTRVRLTQGGSRHAREAFIQDIKAIKGDLKTYSVITAESTWLSCNVEDVTIDRSAENGAGLIIADVILREIRTNATATFTKTKDPASASVFNNGAVQGKPAPANAGPPK